MVAPGVVVDQSDGDEMTEENQNAIVPQSSGQMAIPEGRPGALLQGILSLARDPHVRVDVVQMLVQMQERQEDRQAERDFAIALDAAQAEVTQVQRLGFVDLTKAGEKPKEGSQRGYNFARDEDIDNMLRSIMHKNGFSIFYDRTMREGGGLIVTATLLHSGGHSKTSSFPLPIDTGPGRNNLQALGSTDSYAKRYLKEGFFNIVRKGRDDDGSSFGKKYITTEQCVELRLMLKEAGRQEGPFLERLFSGNVRSVEEIEIGTGFLAARNTLDGVIMQTRNRRDKADADLRLGNETRDA